MRAVAAQRQRVVEAAAGVMRLWQRSHLKIVFRAWRDCGHVISSGSPYHCTSGFCAWSYETRACLAAMPPVEGALASQLYEAEAELRQQQHTLEYRRRYIALRPGVTKMRRLTTRLGCTLRAWIVTCALLFSFLFFWWCSVSLHLQP